jgi:hypothetical protein
MCHTNAESSQNIEYLHIRGVGYGFTRHFFLPGKSMRCLTLAAFFKNPAGRKFNLPEGCCQDYSWYGIRLKQGSFSQVNEKPC